MTIKDIARLSGYGIGTVSRVINNHPDVSDKARQRIMEVIEETNFQPNSNAKHLKMRAVSSIAIIIKGNQNILFTQFLNRSSNAFWQMMKRQLSAIWMKMRMKSVML